MIGILETIALFVVGVAVGTGFWYVRSDGGLRTKHADATRASAAHDILQLLMGRFTADLERLQLEISRLSEAVDKLPKRGRPGRPPRDPSAAAPPAAPAKPRKSRKSTPKPKAPKPDNAPQTGIEAPGSPNAPAPAPTPTPEPAHTLTLPLDLQ